MLNFIHKFAVMRFVFVPLLLASMASAQYIVSVQNAASLGSASPAAAIAPGSIVSIQIVRGGPVVINPDVSKITVKLRRPSDSSEYELKVLQSFLGATLALIPEYIPLGPVELLYAQDGLTSPPVALTIISSAFGLFTQSRNGLGSALAQNGPEFALNKLLNPALPADVVTIWGTGLGDATTGGVSVEVGGLPASVLTPAKRPDFRGLDQINFRLPSGHLTDATCRCS